MVIILLLLMKIMHTHIIQLKIITHMSRMEMVLSGSNVGKGNWSKIEVAHKGNSITYGNSY